MIERSRRARLSHQPGTGCGIVEARGRQDFDCHLAIELLVPGAIHLAHAPGPEPVDDSIVCELLALHRTSPDYRAVFNTNRCARRFVTISAVYRLPFESAAM